MSKEYFAAYKKLYGSEEKRVSQSKCCKEEVDVLHGQSCSYYVCKKCHKPCEINLSAALKKDNSPLVRECTGE